MNKILFLSSTLFLSLFNLPVQGMEKRSAPARQDDLSRLTSARRRIELDRTPQISNALLFEAMKALETESNHINVQDSNGITPLMHAASQGNKNTVKLLLDHGAEINLRNNVGTTALMLASLNGHHDVVQLLLSHGAAITLKNNNNSTALMFAAFGGHNSIIEILLHRAKRYGIDPKAIVNLKNNNGLTALMYAIAQSHIDIIKLLLGHGADVNLKYNNDKTAIDLVIDLFERTQEIKELLLAAQKRQAQQNNNNAVN